MIRVLRGTVCSKESALVAVSPNQCYREQVFRCACVMVQNHCSAISVRMFGWNGVTDRKE